MTALGTSPSQSRDRPEPAPRHLRPWGCWATRGESICPLLSSRSPHLSQRQRREESASTGAATSLMGHRRVTCQRLPEPANPAHLQRVLRLPAAWPQRWAARGRCPLPLGAHPSQGTHSLAPLGRTLSDRLCWARTKPIPRATVLGSPFTLGPSHQVHGGEAGAAEAHACGQGLRRSGTGRC